MKKSYLQFLSLMVLGSLASWSGVQAGSVVIYKNSTGKSLGIAAPIEMVTTRGRILWIQTEFKNWIAVPFYNAYSAKLARFQLEQEQKSIDLSGCLVQDRVISSKFSVESDEIETWVELKLSCSLFTSTPLYSKAPHAWYEMRDIQAHPLVERRTRAVKIHP